MKNHTSKIISVLFVLVSLLLSSCMGMMMMGGHDDHSEHQATTITKEVTNGEYTLGVSIEPLTVVKEGKITISLRSKNNVPESVNVHYMISKSSSTDSSAKHDHSKHSATNEEFKTIHQNITMLKGTSTVLFTPPVAGSFVLHVEIESLLVGTLDANFMAHEKKSSGMGGMMGMFGDYWYLGALAMAGMMVVVWSVRGGL